jgi:uncharacterized protein DUF5069
MLDTGRATLAGKNGEYHYNCTADQHLVKFLGFDPDALLKELATSKGDGEMLEWVKVQGRIHVRRSFRHKVSREGHW